jgi:hypothetical protein
MLRLIRVLLKNVVGLAVSIALVATVTAHFAGHPRTRPPAGLCATMTSGPCSRR